MFNGHRGIKSSSYLIMKQEKGEITSQNHGFAVDRNAAELKSRYNNNTFASK